MRRTLLICTMVLAFCAGCAGTLGTPSKPSSTRTVRVKVVADLSFASHATWRNNAVTLIGAASNFFKDWFDIAFVIDTMVIWDIDRAACHTTMFDWDCLVQCVPRDSADIVIHFARDHSPRSGDLAGISLFTLGYVRVTQLEWNNIPGGFELAFVTLVHELGHQFGAFHVFLDDRYKVPYVMNPQLTRKLLSKQGVQTVVAMPEWHPANQEIIKALRSRPFNATAWSKEHWKPIEDAYRRVRAQYVPFRLDDIGRLSGYEHNELYQPDYFYFLANWAAACGIDSCAMNYIDSVAILARAMQRTCVECGTNCQAHLCRYTGSVEWRIEQWLDRRLADYHFERALLHARFGRSTQAAADFVQFTKLSKRLSSSEIDKHRRELALYQEIASSLLARDAPSDTTVVPAPQPAPVAEPSDGDTGTADLLPEEENL